MTPRFFLLRWEWNLDFPNGCSEKPSWCARILKVLLIDDFHCTCHRKSTNQEKEFNDIRQKNTFFADVIRIYKDVNHYCISSRGILKPGATSCFAVQIAEWQDFSDVRRGDLNSRISYVSYVSNNRESTMKWRRVYQGSPRWRELLNALISRTLSTSNKHSEAMEIRCFYFVAFVVRYVSRELGLLSLPTFQEKNPTPRIGESRTAHVDNVRYVKARILHNSFPSTALQVGIETEAFHRHTGWNESQVDVSISRT